MERDAQGKGEIKGTSINEVKIVGLCPRVRVGIFG
jgi:hypothetical protein